MPIAKLKEARCSSKEVLCTIATTPMYYIFINIVRRNGQSMTRSNNNSNINTSNLGRINGGN
jgi:hypothetical protein